MSSWFREHAGTFGGQLLFDEPLSRHTYYRIGGPAAVLAIPKTEADLQWLRRGIAESRMLFFILGSGSNLLVSDQGYAGLVIKAGRLNLETTVLEDDGARVRLQTGGSVAISSLLRRAAQEGWAGLEFLTGIPGSIGGVVRMNGGTHLGEARDRLKRVEAYLLAEGDGAKVVYEGEALKFQYRKNLFLPQGALVWSAQWDLRRDQPAKVKAAIDETLARRKSTQPIDFPSCGSVFKNPKEHGISAWQVIDRLGLRGHQLGKAQFAEKHSNFILNLGGALATDVRGLIELAKRRARDELSLTLEEEVIYLGEF